jgi:hypothetical protein
MNILTKRFSFAAVQEKKAETKPTKADEDDIDLFGEG